MLKQFFSFSGRLNRLRFLGYDVIVTVFLLLLKTFIENVDNTVTAILLLILVIISAVSAFSICVRRLHDIELSGWFALLKLFPIITFILDLILIFKKGTDGPNEYGEDPLSTFYEV